MRTGRRVFWPAQDGGTIDFVILHRDGRTWSACQVKTARIRKGALVCDTRAYKYKPGDFDEFLVVFEDRVWMIPAMHALSTPTLYMARYAAREVTK
jgi:hypothetical protein